MRVPQIENWTIFEAAAASGMEFFEMNFAKNSINLPHPLLSMSRDFEQNLLKYDMHSYIAYTEYMHPI